MQSLAGLISNYAIFTLFRTIRQVAYTGEVGRSHYCAGAKGNRPSCAGRGSTGTVGYSGGVVAEISSEPCGCVDSASACCAQ